MGSSNSPLQAASQAVFRPLDKGGVVLNVETGDYYELNASGRFLWEQVEAGLSRDSVVDALTQQYGIDRAAAEADVDDFLAELRRRRLLEP